MEWVPMKDAIYCFLPECKNNSNTNPDITFVPIRSNLKQEWCRIVGRNVPKRVLYCCDNHLNLEKDLENFMQWKHKGKKPKMSTTAVLRNVNMLCATPSTSTFIVDTQQLKKDLANYLKYTMGFSKKIRLREGVVPTKFSWKNDNRKITRQKVKSAPGGTMLPLTRDNSCDLRDSSDTDDAAEDMEYIEGMSDVETRVDTLEQQSNEYDRKFKEFGETVTSCLKSLPIVSALRLHKSLEIVIDKFFSSLPETAKTNDSSYSKEFGKKKEGTTSKKGKKKSSNQASKASLNQKVQIISESATTSDLKSKSLDVTFTPNRLAKATEGYNVPVTMPLVKKSAGNRSYGIKPGIQSIPVLKTASSTSSEPKLKPRGLTITPIKLVKSKEDFDLQSPTPLEEDNGSSISFCIDPGSQLITVVRTAPKRKEPFHEDPTSEMSEPEKQARLDDYELDVDINLEENIKLEEDECIVKTEYDSDNDCGDPLELAG